MSTNNIKRGFSPSPSPITANLTTMATIRNDFPSSSHSKGGAGGNSYSSNPSSGGGDAFKKQSRFKQNEYRDFWAFIMFYICLVIYYGIIGYLIYLQSLNKEGISRFSTISFRFQHEELLTPFLVGCGISILISASITALAILCIFYNPVAFIKGSFFGMIGWTAFMSIVALFSPFPLGCIAGILSCILLGIFYFFSRKRIPFSAVILKNVVDIIRIYPAPVGLSGLGTILQGFNVALLLFALPGLKVALDNQIIESNGLVYTLAIYLVFDLFWQIEVIINVIQTTVAGLIATVLLAAGQISNPTWMAFKRAGTISFGSIAFGSLLVSLIQTIRFLVSMISDDRNSIFAAIADCLLGLIEGLVKYFNYYAYTYIAIYGNSYIESAGQVYQLIKGRGIDSIINDNLIGTVFTLVSLVIGLSCSLVSHFVYKSWIKGIIEAGKGGIGMNLDPMAAVALLSIAVGLVGIVIPLVISEVFKSAATAIFVCYAEEAQAIQANKPELFQELRIRDVNYV